MEAKRRKCMTVEDPVKCINNIKPKNLSSRFHDIAVIHDLGNNSFGGELGVSSRVQCSLKEK